MLRRPNHPLALLAGALVLPLCLIRPVLADPSGDLSIDADIVVPASAHAAEAQSQRELFATAGTGLTIEFDNRDVDIELFEAALPPDIPAPAAHDPAAMALVEASADEGAVLQSADFDVALFEAGLPRDIPAPAGESAAAILATASAHEGESALTSAAKFDVPDFDVALFEASLPPDIPAPARHYSAAATLAAASPHDVKTPLKSAADHLRNKTPAAKQPLRSAVARGKTNDPARTSRSAARNVAAAAPPATISRPRPRAAKPDHGPRELFVARLPPDDRDEVMPAQRPIPVMRMSLPPPSLALK